MIKIAVVDDTELVALGIKLTLEKNQFGTRVSVDDYTSGKDLLENAPRVKYDILIMDIELSEEHQEVEENGMYLVKNQDDVSGYDDYLHNRDYVL